MGIARSTDSKRCRTTAITEEQKHGHRRRRCVGSWCSHQADEQSRPKANLIHTLEAKGRTGRRGRMADYLSRKNFIILDELGNLPFAQSGGRLLFCLISRLAAHRKE
jgi:hypothetical protein